MTSDQIPPVPIEIGLAIRMFTPLCVGAVGNRSGATDRLIQRDAWNRPIIPGSQIKGRLRHACARVARILGHPVCHTPYARDMCPYDKAGNITRETKEQMDRTRLAGTDQNPLQCIICALFGSSVYPSPLAFSDAIYHPPSEPDPPLKPLDLRGQLRSGVGLDRWRRTAQDAPFYTIETTAANIVLHSTISGQWISTPVDEVQQLVALLVTGARLTTRWGGSSSRGLGWADLSLTVTIAGEIRDPATLLEEVPDP
jgi:CRISPR/Cas system CSM-associated protein Csm3 (group 7 of RAMP superfamily)